MKKIIIILVSVAFLMGCEKGIDQKQVTYLITDSESGYALTYLNSQGNKVSENIVVSSRDDEWRYSFPAEPGDIVYLSVLDTVPDSFVKLIIYVNGKVYKQGIRTQYVTKPVTVSGTVPF